MPDVILLNKRPTVVGLPNGVKLPPDPQGRGFPMAVEKYEQIKGLRVFQNLLKSGTLAIKGTHLSPPPAIAEGKKSTTPTSSAAGLSPEQLGALAEANVEEAGLLINATDNLDLLNAWLANDERKGVHRLIEKRLEDLTAPDGAEGDDGEGDDAEE